MAIVFSFGFAGNVEAEISEVGSLDIPMNYFGDVAVVGQTAYCTSSNGGLYKVDVSNPAELRFIERERGAVNGVEAIGQHAFIGRLGESGLSVYNAEGMRYNGAPSDVGGLLLEGGLLYLITVSDSTKILRILNIEDPAHPEEIGQLEIRGPRYLSTRMLINGQLYLSGSNDGRVSSVIVVDVSNPEHPELTSQIDGHRGNIVGIASDGEYLFVANQDGDEGVQVRNFNWELISEIRFYLPQGLVFRQGHLYVVSSVAGESSNFQVFGVSGQGELELIDEFSTGRQAMEMFFVEELCYVVEIGVNDNRESRLLILNVEINEEEQRGQLQHFQGFRQSDQSHSVLIQSSLVNALPMPSGWEIGIFTPDGILAGAGVWLDGEQLGFPVWGDDPMTEEVDGFREGESLWNGLRIWDPETNQEFEGASGESRGSSNWQADDLLRIVTMNHVTDYTHMELRRGWNMISVNVTPGFPGYYDGDEEPQIPSIFNRERYLIDFAMIKDGQGRFYVPERNFCNIPCFDARSGYQIYLNRDQGWRVWGASIAPDADIPLAEGWNMVAYFPDYTLPIGDDDFYAIAPIIEYVTMVKDGDGNFALIREDFSNMPDMRPGQGYKIKVNQDVILNYPPEPNQGDAVNSGEVLTNVYWPRPASTGSDMSILVAGLKKGWEVGAFKKNGQLVGAGVTNAKGLCGLSVCGDDVTTSEIDGLECGEQFWLKVTDNGTRNYILPSTYNYEVDGLKTVEVSPNLIPFVRPVEFKLNGAYPNPFNSSTLVAFDLAIASQTRLSVFDLSGRELVRLVDEALSEGRHSVHLDAAGLPTGTYLIRLQSDQQTADLKVQLVK